MSARHFSFVYVSNNSSDFSVFPFTTTDEWRTPSYKKARDFVNAALKYDPDERPTVEPC